MKHLQVYFNLENFSGLIFLGISIVSVYAYTFTAINSLEKNSLIALFFLFLGLSIIVFDTHDKENHLLRDEGLRSLFIAITCAAFTAIKEIFF